MNERNGMHGLLVSYQVHGQAKEMIEAQVALVAERSTATLSKRHFFVVREIRKIS